MPLPRSLWKLRLDNSPLYFLVLEIHSTKAMTFA